jgi:hypothetical protein
VYVADRMGVLHLFAGQLEVEEEGVTDLVSGALSMRLEAGTRLEGRVVAPSTDASFSGRGMKIVGVPDGQSLRPERRLVLGGVTQIVHLDVAAELGVGFRILQRRRLRTERELARGALTTAVVDAVGGTLRGACRRVDRATRDACWVVGPSLEAEEWRRRVKAAARQRGWRLTTGIGAPGYPWAPRTDLDDEQGTPWHRLGMLPRSFFELYPPEA